MKIKSISLTDFRAFPGPAPTTFELDGKNLLVYGENGSGKSSLFHALKGFFALQPPVLTAYKNSFSAAPLGDIAVTLELDSGVQESWHMALRHERPATGGALPGPFLVPEHPAWRTTQPNLALRQAASIASCLDYRSLLATNYKHGNGEINLFELAVTGLLADYRDLATNSTLGQLWDAVRLSKPSVNRGKGLSKVLRACNAFNNAMQQALSFLTTEVCRLLPLLSADGVTLTRLSFAPIRYNMKPKWTDKGFDNQHIGIEIAFQGHPVERPQDYLNEARLSALGLALYFGSRLACVPHTSQALKLLVLDDVLIGLDQSNRIPVLDVLQTDFRTWQIVLLTHDRLWFETTRARAALNGDWHVIEVFANREADSAYRPTVATREKDVVEDYLQRATFHLGNSDWRASAVYARSAFEMWLKVQCATHSLPISFSLEPRKIDSNVYFNAIEKWVAGNHAKPAFTGALQVLALYRDTVFNPGSHTYPTTMGGGELRAAIAAMRFINDATKHGSSPFQLANYLISKLGVLPEELTLAAGFVRVVFMRRLREFSMRKNLNLPFTMEPREIKPAILWTALSAAGWPAKRNNWVAKVNANHEILLDEWNWPIMQGLTVAKLINAMQALNQK